MVRLLLLSAGDIESNGGPREFWCPVCRNTVTSAILYSVLCCQCNEWLHLKCSGLKTIEEHKSTFKCPKCAQVQKMPTPQITPPVASHSNNNVGMTKSKSRNTGANSNNCCATDNRVSVSVQTQDFPAKTCPNPSKLGYNNNSNNNNRAISNHNDPESNGMCMRPFIASARSIQ